MAYLIQSDCYGDMPQEQVEAALDDRPQDGDAGKAARISAKWDAVSGAVDTEINGLLAPRYAYPFADPVLPAVKTAALALTLEKLWNRRGLYAESNPASRSADAARKHLRDIGSGKILLDAGTVPKVPTGTAAAAVGPALKSGGGTSGRLPI